MWYAQLCQQDDTSNIDIHDIIIYFNMGSDHWACSNNSSAINLSKNVAYTKRKS